MSQQYTDGHHGQQDDSQNDIMHAQASLVEALHPTSVPVQVSATEFSGNHDYNSVPTVHVHSSHEVQHNTHEVQLGGLKGDGSELTEASVSGGDKVDRRFGKRSETARQAVSQGMRNKANQRKDQDKKISLGDRLAVATKLEAKEITPKEAQEMLGCCKSYVSQMMKTSNLQKLRKKVELGLSPSLTKAHLPKFPQLEESLHLYTEEMRKQNPNLNPPVPMATMQEKALELSLQLGLVDFKASNSWFTNFVKRYGLDRMGFQTDDTSKRVSSLPSHDQHLEMSHSDVGVHNEMMHMEVPQEHHHHHHSQDDGRHLEVPQDHQHHSRDHDNRHLEDHHVQGGLVMTESIEVQAHLVETGSSVTQG